MADRKTCLLFFFLILLAFPVIIPFLKSGFPLTDDAEWMIIRFSAFYQELVSGQFPIRWLNRLNNGYGYPVATFLYPGFMYLAIIPKLLGFNFINSIKIIFIISIFASAIFSFFWLKKVFASLQAALIGTLFFIYNPYFVFDLYKRGSIGEILAFSVVFFLLYMISKKQWRWVSLGYAGLILSHNTLAILFLPILASYHFLTLYKNNHSSINRLLLKFFNSLISGFFLSAFFWLPALYELRFTVFNQIKVSNFPEYFLTANQLSLLGLINLIVLSLSFVIFIKKRKQESWRTAFFIIVALLGVILALPISIKFWKIFSLGKFIQFPFRFLSLWAVGIMYLAGFLVSIRKFPKFWGFPIILIIISSCLFLQNQPFFKNIQYQTQTSDYYATNEATTTVQDEYLPLWVKIKPQGHPGNIAELLKSDGEIKVVENKSSDLKIEIDSEKASILQINKIYWPGWEISVNGLEKNLNYKNQNGLIQTDISAGKHLIELKFKETGFRLFADFISLVTLGFIILRKVLWKI